MLKATQAVITTEQLQQLQQQTSEIQVAPALIDYIQQILNFSRDSGEYHFGLSPRAGLALLHAAQAWALVDGRDHVLPEDVQSVLPAVIGHRLLARNEQHTADWVQQLINQVAIP